MLMARNDALRAEVARLRSLVTKKIYRVKRNTGAHVSGTVYDPRPAASVKNMSAKQLRTAQRKFQSFLSRENQYVAAYQSQPIPRKTWERYKSEEQKSNQRIGSFYDRVKGIQLPGQYSSFNIENYKEMRTPKHPHMLNPASNTPNEMVRSPRNMVNERKVRELTEDMHARGTGKWFQQKINEGREQYGAMAEIMGRGDLFEGMNSLTDEQFALLIMYTPFMENASLMYEDAKKAYDHTERSAIRQAAREKATENDMWVQWAAEQSF